MTPTERREWYRLLVKNLIAGSVRWEPFSEGHPPENGELCFDGIRHRAKLVNGAPEFEEHLFRRLKLREPNPKPQ